MTKQEDIWQCFNCGDHKGRHDLWFEGDLCESCNSKINYAIINYNRMELTLWFKEEMFNFDLTEGDIGDFWHGFECNGEVFDVNYYTDSYEDTLVNVVSVYGTKVDSYGYTLIDMDNSYEIEILDTIGNLNNYLNYYNK